MARSGVDVIVAGAGPAGWAVAGACARIGLRTELVDPDPYRSWPATYGAWRDELTDATLTAAVAAGGLAHTIGTTRHESGWQYVIFDNARLRTHLEDPAVQVRLGTVGPDATDRAGVVIDATGPGRAVLGGRRRQVPAEQTAVGVVVGRDAAAACCAQGEVLLMDWRPNHGRPGWPSFLYGVPLGPDAVLLEETSLARRPGLDPGELRLRLHARLRAHGIEPTGREELVRFPVDTPVPLRRGPVVPFGAAAPLVHPATGFSVAAALRLAPRVARAIAEGGAPAAWAQVWSPAALAVHAMRTAGLQALLVMQPDEVARFFDVFFRLPQRHRWAYLTGREDVAGTAAAMGALFAGARWPLRRHLVLRGLDPRRPVSG